MTIWKKFDEEGLETRYVTSDWQVARWQAKQSAKGRGKSHWVREGRTGQSMLIDRLVRDADGVVLAVVHGEARDGLLPPGMTSR